VPTPPATGLVEAFGVRTITEIVSLSEEAFS
jgi:hypothetical protein